MQLQTGDPMQVKKGMRHAQLSTTIDLYGRHADEAQDRLLTAAYDEWWSGDELAAKRRQKAAG
jgi:hypothetical protein